MQAQKTSFREEGRTLVRFLMIAFIAAQFGALVARADIIYTVDTTITSAEPTGNPLQTDTVSGSITTDGTIGVLLEADILSWDLNLTDDLDSANDIELTDANSNIASFFGTALSATATALSFDYGVTGEFGIQENGFDYSGFHYFCFSTGGDCLAGETISPQYYAGDGVVLTGAAEPVGNQPLNQGSAVPEPSSYGLMLTSLLVLGGTLKRKIFR